MTEAYHYAEGDGHKPRELYLIQLVERFGADAILGRPLYAREIYRGTIAERVYTVKKANMNSDSWAEWAKNNPKDSALLERVEIMMAEEDDG